MGGKMRRLRETFLLVIVVFALAACQTFQEAPATPTPTATPKVSEYWALVRQAQKAFARADYAEAMELARQAASLKPGDNTAWELYRQASVAQAADAYLSTLPPHRYRLPVEVFMRDKVNHTRDWFVIDVREPEEFAAGHIEGAINIPLRELMRHLDELPTSKTAFILVYCHSQKRATHALVILHEIGYVNAYNLQGGYAAYDEWLKHNPLPTPGPTPTPEPEEPDLGC